MSVLLCNRSTSTMQYVMTAKDIFVESVRFLSKLSSRYSDILSPVVMKLADELLSNTVKANGIFPSDSKSRELRRGHLLEARASLDALEVELSLVYEILSENPEWAFSVQKGRPMSRQDAINLIHKKALTIGNKISEERNLLTGIIKSDEKRT